MSKAQLRNQISVQRQSLDDDWVELASGTIIDHLKTLEIFSAAKTIALYKALPAEVQLENLFSICWELEKQTCIPVFDRDRRIYEMAAVSHSTSYETGHYGIQEPCSPTPIELNEIDLIVVPGVAFDVAGNRLGRGGGYYDRLLDGFTGIPVAVTFDFQVFPHIPNDSHDRPVSYIVTESKVVVVCNEH